MNRRRVLWENPCVYSLNVNINDSLGCTLVECCMVNRLPFLKPRGRLNGMICSAWNNQTSQPDGMLVVAHSGEGCMHDRLAA